MDVLVLGGTGFLGTPLVEKLLAAGHAVTLFNRGQTNTELFPETPRLLGDRDSDVSALAGSDWDVVYDLSGFHPDQIARSGELLGGHCDYYVFVSSISAYADFAQPGMAEDYPLGQLEEPVPKAGNSESYGPLKALSEHKVAALFPNHVVIRPGVIAGPNDPTDRFTYWVDRLSTPGPHLVPNDLDASLQYIDVRDLAQWLVDLAHSRPQGPFNAVTPVFSFAEFLRAIADESGTPLEPVQLTDEQMQTEEVQPWVDLPLSLPFAMPNLSGFFQVDRSRAVEAGLRTRDLADTVRDVLQWTKARHVDELSAGLSAVAEAALVARYLDV